MTVYITKLDTWKWTHYVNKIINGCVPNVACDNWVFECLHLVALNKIQILDDLQEKNNHYFHQKSIPS
jgi:hypothetical protein